ncbi:MAG: glycosyltransferase family 39 protein [Actinobacteria bacterium]|nr:glycosyltransferase family 39 protein [Actinomycetota bacterium]
MRSRVLPLWPLALLWVAAAAGLSLITTSVRDWFVMTDELVYERLAIAVARTGSPLPHVHGVLVRSLDQLYPLLIAPFFTSGLVAHDLRGAHLLNAWVMTSACIPVFLLARRVTGSGAAAYAVAALALLLPWFVYAPFLLTEVVAYPAFAWAMLALHAAASRPSARNDVLALLAIVLAFLARTEFLFLVVVFPLTLIAVERRNVLRAHRVAMAFTGALVLAGIGLLASGGNLATLTVYGQEVRGGLVPAGTATWYLKHLAMLALGVGVLPFVVGGAWLLGNALRGDAFASLGAITVALLPLETTSYDLHVGGAISRDRYLFYVAPLVLVAFAAALLDRRRPLRSLVVPAAVVTAGFALGPESAYTWNDPYGRLNADTPVSGLFSALVPQLHGMGPTRAVLAVGTVVATLVFAFFARARLLAPVLGVLLAAALAAETSYLFDRLLTNDGTASRPLTVSPASQFDWIDETAGRNADVTIVPSPINTNWFQTEQYWRDTEFWNVSVDRDAHYGSAGTFAFTGLWFPKVVLRFDAHGRANASPTPYVVEALKESRFRISGKVVASTGDTMLIRTREPWRADWTTAGVYDDGWTMPHTVARVRVYALPNQTAPLLRYLTFQIWAPSGVTHRRFTVRSNLETRRGIAGAATAFVNSVHVCVPPRGSTDVTLTVQGSSTIPGDMATEQQSVGSRQGGVFLSEIALADDLGGRCRIA